MGAILVGTAVALVISHPDISGAAAGFILAFAGSINVQVSGVLRKLRYFELKGISLERTTEYRMLEMESVEPRHFCMHKDDNKASHASDEAVNSSSWPSDGSLRIVDLCVRYGPDMPNILHKVSFSVEGGQRVGIVGATGGGKSTLAKAFFAFVDVTHGAIEIDGRGTMPCTSPMHRLILT